jgi:hypothetical protein
VSLLLTLGAVFILAAIQNRRRIGRTAKLIGALAPALVLPIYFVLSTFSEPTLRILPPRWHELLGLDVLVSHDVRTYRVALAIAVLYGILIGFTLVRERILTGRRGLRLEPRDGFLLLAAATVLLYFLVPSKIAGGAFLRERIGMFPFLVILPWLSARYPRGGASVVGLAASALAVTHVVITMAPFSTLNRAIDDYTAGIPFVRENETILAAQIPDEVIPGSRIRALRHAIGYYEIATGAIGLPNYEAGTGHFPLRYRPGRDPNRIIREVEAASPKMRPWLYPIPVDNVLLWYPRRYMPGLPRLLEHHPPLRWIFEHYRLVLQGESLWLLKRKEGPWPPR